MMTLSELARQPPVRAALEGFSVRLEETIVQIVAIQQIPSPTFHELERARYIARRFEEIGLVDVSLDSLNNVFGRLPGSGAGASPLVISAHLDTVFPPGTDLTVHRDGARISGPGIADNSAGLAGLCTVAGALIEHRLSHMRDIVFVANVGEEGMGDLCGMRAVVERFGENATYIVVEGGLFGRLTHQAVGVRRYLVEVTTPGGHSWGAFGTPSAIHVLGRLIASIDSLEVPLLPKSTFNVGVIEGGLSVNSIAGMARMWLDLRSESDEVLLQLEDQVKAKIAEQEARAWVNDTSVQIEMKPVGNRPAGQLDRQTRVVALADEALRLMGLDEVQYIVSSTDANVPLSKGYEAVCLGLARSANAHRPDEYLDVSNLPAGLGQLLLVALAVAAQA